MVLAAEVNAQTIVLEDFATRRLTWANDGTKLFDIYTGEDPDQIDGGFSGGIWTITGATTAGAPAGCYTGCGFYWHSAPYPYLWNGGTFPNGFMQSYIKSGTFNASTTNRMNFKLKCNADVPRSSSGSSTFNVGTYVKAHTDTDQSNQGRHFYHGFSPNVYNGHWMLVELNTQPDHEVGISGQPANDPVMPSVHYFDGMTRFYFDNDGTSNLNGAGFSRKVCQFKELWLRNVSNENDHMIASTTGQHNGSYFEVTWATPPNQALTYDVAYSRSTMKPNNFAGGTSGGTVQSTGNDYPGVYWQSPTLPLDTGLYVGIRAPGDTIFTEIFIPPMDTGGGGPPPAAPTSVRVSQY